ncbi:hypothetical protein KC335_g57 [Hortaea werneckii]|nr:hypothetical protein KC335_g57 [Hortaea werneckii]
MSELSGGCARIYSRTARGGLSCMMRSARFVRRWRGGRESVPLFSVFDVGHALCIIGAFTNTSERGTNSEPIPTRITGAMILQSSRIYISIKGYCSTACDLVFRLLVLPRIIRLLSVCNNEDVDWRQQVQRFWILYCQRSAYFGCSRVEIFVYEILGLLLAVLLGVFHRVVRKNIAIFDRFDADGKSVLFDIHKDSIKVVTQRIASRGLLV